MNPRLVTLAACLALVFGGCSAPIPSDATPPTPPPASIATVVATPSPSAPPSALPVLASRETSHEGTALVIAVNSLHTTAGSTTLNFTITNLGSAPWKHWTTMSAPLSGQDNMTLASVFVLDTANGRRLLPARDAKGRCVCSELGSENIGVGQSMVFSAVFAPLPVGVETVGVHIPLAGTFDNVPVSR